jgi:hypothetical protein
MPHVPSIYDALHIPVLLQSLVLATIVVLLVSLLVNAGLKRAADGGVIPEEGITLRNFLEVLLDGIVSLGKDVMGEKCWSPISWGWSRGWVARPPSSRPTSRGR